MISHKAVVDVGYASAHQFFWPLLKTACSSRGSAEFEIDLKATVVCGDAGLLCAAPGRVPDKRGVKGFSLYYGMDSLGCLGRSFAVAAALNDP